MAETVSNHQQTTFTTPADGSAQSASEMRTNYNALGTTLNAHDADSGIHLQSGAVASRPAAGTAGRKWLATDASAVYITYDNGASWLDLSYLKLSGGTVTGAITVSAGGIAVTGNSTITGTLGGVTTLTCTTVTATNLGGTLTTAAQPNITSLGTLTSLTLTKILGDGTSFTLRNSGDTADVIKYTDATTTLAIGGGAGVTAISMGTSGTGSVTISSNKNVTLTAGSAGGNVLLGTQAPATTATDGFPVIGTCAGTPTGAATNGAIVVDSSGTKLWVRVGGAWKGVAVA